jgi:hypothetical protein
MTPNYAINPTPEQALRSNRAVLPARVIAALEFLGERMISLTTLFLYGLLSPTTLAGGEIVDAEKPVIVGDVVRRSWMVGTWRGTAKTKDGETRVWDVTRKVDGTFRVEFCIACNTSKEERLVEYGVWGVSGDVYFTITRGWVEGQGRLEADPRDEGLYDAYYILKAEGNSMRYRSASTGNEFTIERVSAKDKSL